MPRAPIFLTVLFLTTLSGGASLHLASQSNLTEAQKQVLSTSTATWQTGIGAIFGLLSVRAINSHHSNEDSNDEDEDK